MKMPDPGVRRAEFEPLTSGYVEMGSTYVLRSGREGWMYTLLWLVAAGLLFVGALSLVRKQSRTGPYSGYPAYAVAAGVSPGLTATSTVRSQISPTSVAEADRTEFRSGGDLSVGVEEELLLVDGTNHLATRDSVRMDALGAELRSRGVVDAELFCTEIEFSTIACRSADGVRDCLVDFRSALRRAGVRPMAVGVHPTGPFGEVDLTRSERYDTIGSSLAGLLRTPTAALQVHVGMPDVDAAMTAFRVLRHRLAVLRALAAGSPYWHGRDSGLASSRWAVLRSYPRSGVPPVVRDWEEYVALVQAVVAAAEAPDDTHVWWDLRARPTLGTLEVRVMDAQPSLDVVAGFAALVQGVARHALERPDAVDMPSEVLIENDFRAARFGLEGRVVDTTGTMRPIREVAEEMLHEARDVLAPDGLDDALCGIERILNFEPEYQRQRRIRASRGMPAVLKDLVERTGAAD